MSDEITIRMPEELRQKWLAGLRGGRYRQATGTMYDPASDGYCCLGVLQAVAGGDGAVEPSVYPSKTWREMREVQFLDRYGEPAYGNPYLPTLGEQAANANDAGRTFAEIADAIERHSEGF